MHSVLLCRGAEEVALPPALPQGRGTTGLIHETAKEIAGLLRHGPEEIAQPATPSGVRPRLPQDELLIRSKKIWGGYRATFGSPSLGWTTGFAAKFWEGWKTAAGWRCESQGSDCTRRDYSQDQEGLEIGHIEGFYNCVTGVDTIRVCDGERHWYVVLYADVVAANENMSNLQPQCRSCNRARSQQKKDPRLGGEYQPERGGDCPGDSCTTRKIEAL